MKKFRFRGRHEHTQVWIEGDGVEYIEAKEYGEEPRAFILCHGFRTEVEPETVSQTTGKMDANGMEIFDGDVVVDGKIVGNRHEQLNL